MDESAELNSWIEQAQGGSRTAFEALVRRFEWPVRAWLVARCPPGADADEVGQLTFLEMFKRIGEYRTGSNFRAWLFTIARFQLMAECTRLKRVVDYHSRYAPAALAAELERRATAEYSEAANELDLKLAHLRECLEKLDATGQSALQFRYADGLPLSTISTRIGRTLAGTKKYLFLLRQRLHECIDRKLAASES